MADSPLDFQHKHAEIAVDISYDQQVVVVGAAQAESQQTVLPLLFHAGMVEEEVVAEKMWQRLVVTQFHSMSEEVVPSESHLVLALWVEEKAMMG